MKKQVIFFVLIIFFFTGCESKKNRETTVLGFGTQYFNMPELLNGKVKTMTEKNYWAVQDGDSYKKGNPVTVADRDSMLNGWTNDFEVSYDENGDLISCMAMDESGKQIWKNEYKKVNSLIARVENFRRDTLTTFDTIRYGDNGLISGTRYRALTDTLMFSIYFRNNEEGSPIELVYLNSKKDTAVKNIREYDAQNRFISNKSYDKEGKYMGSNEIKYNDKGRPSELYFRDKDNKVVESNIMTYEYDQKGNWIKAIVKDVKGTENKYIITERSYTYHD